MKTPNLERCLIILNPAGTNKSRNETFLKQINSLFPPDQIETIETTRSDYKKYERLSADITAKLYKNTLICIMGGDGTLGLVINLLLGTTMKKELIDSVAILPLWGGNANDLAYMANGSPNKADISEIIKNGVLIPVHPLEVVITHDTQIRTRLAISYTSFGASAYTTHHMSRPSYRQRRLYQMSKTRIPIETISVIKNFLKARKFKIETAQNQSQLYDLLLINGSRIAKLNAAPAKLDQRSFYEIRVKHKYPLFLAHFGKRYADRSLKHLHQNERQLTVKQGVWAQLDGEVLWIAPDSTITVKSHKQPFYLLSTKLT